MVTINNNQEGEDVDLEQRLTAEWQTMLTGQQAAAEFIGASQKKALGGENGQVAFFNNKLVSVSIDHSLTQFLNCVFKLGHQQVLCG